MIATIASRLIEIMSYRLKVLVNGLTNSLLFKTMLIGNYDIFLEIIFLTPFLFTEIREEVEELTISSAPFFCADKRNIRF